MHLWSLANGWEATETGTNCRTTCPRYIILQVFSPVCWQVIVYMFCYSTGGGNSFKFIADTHACFTLKI